MFTALLLKALENKVGGLAPAGSLACGKLWLQGQHWNLKGISLACLPSSSPSPFCSLQRAGRDREVLRVFSD